MFCTAYKLTLLGYRKQKAHHEMRQRTWTFLRRHHARTTKCKTYCPTKPKFT